MLRTVKVYGHLAEHCGQSVFEGIGTCACRCDQVFAVRNFPDLRLLNAVNIDKVAVGQHDLQLADASRAAGYPMGADDVVKIMPESGAGGRRGLGHFC